MTAPDRNEKLISSVSVFYFTPVPNKGAHVLLSMTGFGDSRWQSPSLTIAVEMRAVNNRFLKVSIKSPDAYQFLETEIERTIRESLKRGSIFVQLYIRREPKPEDYQINLIALEAFLNQLEKVTAQRQQSTNIDLAALLAVPGVITESETIAHRDVDEDWKLVGPVLKEALSKLQAMRTEEGRKMADELRGQAELIAGELVKVKERAPFVVVEYRKRLNDKLQSILSEQSIVHDPANLVKEVAVFADRTDINEEVVRLGSHIEQFQAFLLEQESPGRKLDFLIQEMNREVNTIGSKANDVTITRNVVEMKAAIEKMRELIQNVE